MEHWWYSKFATTIFSHQLDLSGWLGFLLPVHRSNHSPTCIENQVAF
nr:MAG TPA: hypothetical protein [Caudoviricetes sp.]